MQIESVQANSAYLNSRADMKMCVYLRREHISSKLSPERPHLRVEKRLKRFLDSKIVS